MYRSLRDAVDNDNHDYIGFNKSERLKSVDSSELTDLLYFNCSRGRFVRTYDNLKVCELLLNAGANPCLETEFSGHPVIYAPIGLKEWGVPIEIDGKTWTLDPGSNFLVFELMLSYCHNPHLLAEMIEYPLGCFFDFTRFLQIMLHSGYSLTANDMYFSQSVSPFGYHTRLLLDAGFDGFEHILFDDGLMSHIGILGINSHGVTKTVEDTWYVDMYLGAF